MPQTERSYDLVVIGGGPAGVVAASTAAESRRSVALIDYHRELGGAGINTGTLPSKTLRETALALSGFRSRRLYGVDLSLRREVTIGDFLGREQQVRSAWNLQIDQLLKTRKADVYCGAGAFADPHTVRVRPADGGEELLLRGEAVLIATGSSPVRPAVFPFGRGEVYDSDTILSLDRIPKSLAVVGAGIIGSEYACTFSALGARVHVVDGRDVLLPALDGEVSRALAAAMERGGISFHWNERVGACAVLESGEISLRLSSGPALKVDAVLVAAGRTRNTESLGLPLAGVATGAKEIIPVDERYRTNVAHIYAAGDVIGFPALASTSMEQARRAVRHALGLPAVGISPLLPIGVYTIPEVGMVGETEESLKERGVAYVAGRATYRENVRGRIIGDEDGFLKLLYRREDMGLLGVHVLGEFATEIVHVGMVAMMSARPAELFVQACFNVPSLSSLYKAATLNALASAAATGARLAP